MQPTLLIASNGIITVEIPPPIAPAIRIREDFQRVVNGFPPEKPAEKWLARFLKEPGHRLEQTSENIKIQMLEIKKEITGQLDKGDKSKGAALAVLNAAAIKYINKAPGLQYKIDKSRFALQEQAMNTAKEVLLRDDIGAKTATNIMLSILDSLPAYKKIMPVAGVITPRYLNNKDKAGIGTLAKNIFSKNPFENAIRDIMGAIVKHRLDLTQEATVIGKMLTISHADAYVLETVKDWTKNHAAHYQTQDDTYGKVNRPGFEGGSII